MKFAASVVEGSLVIVLVGTTRLHAFKLFCTDPYFIGVVEKQLGKAVELMVPRDRSTDRFPTCGEFWRTSANAIRSASQTVLLAGVKNTPGGNAIDVPSTICGLLRMPVSVAPVERTHGKYRRTHTRQRANLGVSTALDLHRISTALDADPGLLDRYTAWLSAGNGSRSTTTNRKKRARKRIVEASIEDEGVEGNADAHCPRARTAAGNSRS